jgi:hypothetical protein
MAHGTRHTAHGHGHGNRIKIIKKTLSHIYSFLNCFSMYKIKIGPAADTAAAPGLGHGNGNGNGNGIMAMGHGHGISIRIIKKDFKLYIFIYELFFDK